MYVKGIFMRIGKTARDVKCQMNKKFQNLLKFEILIVFQIQKILKSSNLEK